MSHNEGGSVKSSYLNLTPKRKCGHDADGLIVENCHMLQALSDTTDLILLLLKRHSEDRSLLIPPPREDGGIGRKAMAPHSSTLAWKIPRTQESGRLQSMGS